MMAEKSKRHGLVGLMRRVNARGISAVDGRTVAAKAVVAWRNELLAALGGDPSPQRLALLEMITRTRLFIDHVDAFLIAQVAQGSLINRRKKSLSPVLKERQALVDSLARLLAQLGLQRVAKPVPALADYIAAKAAK
jgi:hypothetical protein